MFGRTKHVVEIKGAKFYTQGDKGKKRGLFRRCGDFVGKLLIVVIGGGGLLFLVFAASMQ